MRCAIGKNVIFSGSSNPCISGKISIHEAALGSNHVQDKLNQNIPGVRIVQPVEANAVFASLPRKAINKLLKKYFFYTVDEDRNVVRWMCSWNTTEKQVDDFAKAIAESCSGKTK